MTAISVGIVEDHALVLQGIKLMMRAEPSVSLEVEATTPRQLLELLKDKQPQVLLMDISLPQMSGIELTKLVLKEYPKIKVLFLSSNTTKDYVRMALRVGGRGFVSKSAEPEALIEGIVTVAEGRRYFDPSLSQQVFADFVEFTHTEAGKPTLTDRELEILRYLANGTPQKEIAEIANISIKTVEKHRKSIFEKLKLNSQADLIKYAIREHIIEL